MTLLPSLEALVPADHQLRHLIRLLPPEATTRAGESYFMIEQFSYDEAHDEFTRSMGKALRYVRTERTGQSNLIAVIVC